MLKLEGKSLSLNLPISTLKIMGTQYRIAPLDDYIERVFTMLREKDLIPAERNDVLEDLQPYYSNFVYIDTIVEKMVVNNITFSQAVEASEDEIQKSQEALGFVILMLKVTGMEEMINQLLVELIDVASDDIKALAEGEENGKTATIPVKLKDLPQATLYTLQNYGLYSVAETAASDPQIRDLIHNKLINPVIESTLKVGEEEANLISDLTPEDKKELQDLVTECRDDNTLMYPLQTIISTVLTKAISDNITFSQAAATFKPEELLNKVLTTIHEAPDMAKYQPLLEKITKLFG